MTAEIKNMKKRIDDLPAWKSQGSTLKEETTLRYDAILQVLGKHCIVAPYEALFAVAKKRQQKQEFPTIMCANGSSIKRVIWKSEEDTFSNLQALREGLVALMELNPRSLAVDIRIQDAIADAVFSTFVVTAPLTNSTAPHITFTGVKADTVQSIAHIAAANTICRRLIQKPPNELTPASFAQESKELTKKTKLTTTVYNEASLKRIQAGAILAVGRGSDQQSPMIVRLKYKAPRRNKKLSSIPLVTLVGKGVCFDTGGVNIKPARFMRGMSKDMTGAAVALASIWAAEKLCLPVDLEAWLVLAQNDIGPNAYRPDEVITAANGKRIEIVHTDAEGRMLLADTLHLASQEKPNLIISYATLTGSMHAALGERISGFFSNDDRLTSKALQAATHSGERLCHFPLAKDYFEGLKSDIADIRQCPETGDADHIYAALFLQEFIRKKSSWLHLDLSSASCKGGLAGAPGPLTGFGVAWTLSFLKQLIR